MPVVLKYKGTGKDVSLAASFLNNWEEKVCPVLTLLRL